MKLTKFNKGIFSSTLGSVWWGFLGTYYFHFIAFVGTFEIVIHRSIWTSFILLITTIFFKKINIVKKTLLNKKKIFILFLTSILIFANWSFWIYAVETNRIIDASFGYFIFPILSVFFGFVFFKEKLNKKRITSLLLVTISILYLIFNLNSFPWIGLLLATMWVSYNLLRKKINIEADVGLFIESLFILPIVFLMFFYLIQKDLNYFTLSNPDLMALLFLAGPMTVIPLFLYIKGVQLSGLGPSGMIFFLTPTGQFLLGFFHFNEAFNMDKFLSFILIWIAVFIYLHDLYENY